MTHAEKSLASLRDLAITFPATRIAVAALILDRFNAPAAAWVPFAALAVACWLTRFGKLRLEAERLARERMESVKIEGELLRARLECRALLSNPPTRRATARN